MAVSFPNTGLFSEIHGHPTRPMAGVEECEGFTVIGSNFGGGGMPGSDGAGQKVRAPAGRSCRPRRTHSPVPSATGPSPERTKARAESGTRDPSGPARCDAHCNARDAVLRTGDALRSRPPGHLHSPVPREGGLQRAGRRCQPEIRESRRRARRCMAAVCPAPHRSRVARYTRSLRVGQERRRRLGGHERCRASGKQGAGPPGVGCSVVRDAMQSEQRWGEQEACPHSRWLGACTGVTGRRYQLEDAQLARAACQRNAAHQPKLPCHDQR